MIFLEGNNHAKHRMRKRIKTWKEHVLTEKRKGYPTDYQNVFQPLISHKHNIISRQTKTPTLLWHYFLSIFICWELNAAKYVQSSAADLIIYEKLLGLQYPLCIFSLSAHCQHFNSNINLTETQIFSLSNSGRLVGFGRVSVLKRHFCVTNVPTVCWFVILDSLFKRLGSVSLCLLCVKNNMQDGLKQFWHLVIWQN